MQCPKCHTDNPDSVKFCGECGLQLETAGATPIVVTRTLEAPVLPLARGSLFAGRYEVIEELGQGGMGTVFRVFDTKTEEEIALKLIKPEISSDKKTIERFRSELTTARKISHRNVCRMFDLGEEKGAHFITMEYVPGEDLKSLINRVKLDVGSSIKIAQQVCEGMSEAHRAGVVHRDLKPSNIMIDKDGNARIMDFGIARSPDTKGITKEGLMIGTPEYMSPEQAEAMDLDQRSDIYAFGVILYEMLTGKLPFDGETPLAVVMKHKEQSPEDPRGLNPHIPPGLSQLILKCLEKEKENRFQNAGEIRTELERVAHSLSIGKGIEAKKASPAAKKAKAFFRRKMLIVPALIVAVAIITIGVIQFLPRKGAVAEFAEESSIAVLPFEDLSPQRDQAYFCDGMTDEIITKLSSLTGIKVISRSSVMRYRNPDRDIKEIGRKLGVKTVLEGSVRKEADDIRITVELVDVADRFQIWADSYDQKFERIFDIQSNIAENIARSLRATFSSEEGERLQKKPTKDLEAYWLYLQGRYFRNQTTIVGFEKAIQYFEKAVEMDPDYALAYVGLANVYNMLGGYEFMRPKEVYPKARAAALKAIEIDEELAEAHTALAWNNFRFNYDWEGAEREYQRASELRPDDSALLGWDAMYLLCAGRYDEAVLVSQRAQELDPLSLPVNTMEGFALFIAGRYGRAIEKLKTILEMNPDFAWANSVLGEVYEKQGLYADSFAAFEKAIASYGESPSLFMGFLGHAYAKGGRVEEARKILGELEELSTKRYVSPYAVGIIYLGLGQDSRAFELLDQAYEERTTMMSSLRFDHRFDDYRSDPRFIALLERVGLDR